MIDIHAHVLPEIDDGAVSMEQSLAMLRQAANCGIETIIATPHAPSPAAGAMSTVEHLVSEVQLRANHSGIAVRVLPGFELLLTPTIIDDLTAGEPVSLGGTRYLLAELPGKFRPPNLSQALSTIHRGGHRVILAHAERYDFIKRDTEAARELIDQGVFVQINAGSLAGSRGPVEQRCAKELLQDGLVHFLASDAHDSEDYGEDVPAAVAVSEKLVGPAVTRAIVYDNAMAVLNDAVGVPQQPNIVRNGFTSALVSRILGK